MPPAHFDRDLVCDPFGACVYLEVADKASSALCMLLNPAIDRCGIGRTAKVIPDVLSHAAVGKPVKVHINGRPNLLRRGVGMRTAPNLESDARLARLPLASRPAKMTHEPIINQGGVL